MTITDRIDKYLNEGLRGFKNKKELGDEIEDMDINVESKGKKKFDKILNSYLKKVDPNNDLSIVDAVQKLDDRKAQNLIDDLLELHYDK